MIRTLGWLTLIGFGMYTGVLQAMMIFIGAAIIWFGSLLASMGGAI